MPLVPCRACGHTVDISAEACPGCGATNPGRKMSRQQHDLIVLLIQLIIGTALVGPVAGQRFFSGGFPSAYSGLPGKSEAGCSSRSYSAITSAPSSSSVAAISRLNRMMTALVSEP